MKADENLIEEQAAELEAQVSGRGWGRGKAISSVLFRGGPFIALLLLGAYLSFASPHFLTGSNLVNISRQTAVTAILAVGQTLVIISAGIDLSVAATAALSASVATVVMTQRIEIFGFAFGPVDFWVGLPVALLVGVL